jgi:hypothetical protein
MDDILSWCTAGRIQTIATYAVRIRRSDEQAHDGRATYPALKAYRQLLETYFGPQLREHLYAIAALLRCRHDISFMLHRTRIDISHLDSLGSDDED